MESPARPPAGMRTPAGPIRHRLPARDVALLVIVPLIWGLNFIPIRWALDEIPPLALSGLRFLLAAIPMVFLVPRPRLSLMTVIAYGLAIGLFQFGLLFLAIKLGLAAGLASLLMQLQMFFTMGLAATVTGDRIERHQVVGGIVSLVGLAVLGWTLVNGGAAASPLSLVLIVLASLSWAVGNVIAKAAAKTTTFDMFGLVVWSSLVAPVPLALLSFWLEGGWAPLVAIRHASWSTWASLLFMAYAATLFGYSAWNRLLRRYPAGVVSPFTMMIPVAGLAGGGLVLHEQLQAAQLLGACIIMIGLGWAVLGRPTRTTTAVPGRADAPQE